MDKKKMMNNDEQKKERKESEERRKIKENQKAHNLNFISYLVQLSRELKYTVAIRYAPIDVDPNWDNAKVDEQK